MKSSTKHLPISLIKTLNSFNSSIIAFRDILEITSTEKTVTFNSAKYVEVTIKYSMKDTTSFFELSFVPIKDYLNYNYYPNEISSSKIFKIDKHVLDEKMHTELEKHLTKWKNNLTELVNLKDPLDFFNDTFVESYSAEIIDFVGDDVEKDYYPISFEKQLKVIALIIEQQDFVNSQIKEVTDETSEKFQDLNNTLIELEYIKENLPRMTSKELKERWSSTFAVLIKWCAKQLAVFAKIDAQNDGNISRVIGNLIGGIFNLPRME
jgi:hypothetical protein